jgi:transcriptional regulator with XRE-family HTH domain
MSAPLSSSATKLVEKIHSLLATRGLSLADICRESRSHSADTGFGHVPHNLYDAIRKRQFSPSIFQIASLSALSGYRFIDWLKLFDFSLDDVSRFQALLPALRTAELDARIYDLDAKVPWFREVRPHSLSSPLLPLSRWLAHAEPRRAARIAPAMPQAIRFVKIGSHDAFAFPNVLPGSIVRVKPLANRHTEVPVENECSSKLFLVEHGRGFACSQIYRSGQNQIVLCPRQVPYASLELEQTTQALVLGVADLEIRHIVSIEKPLVPGKLGGYWPPVELPVSLPARHVGALIRRARKRSGLSFREASKRTRLIAKTLRDSRYFCAAGSLSDYETRTSPPRHIQKMISICATYFVSAADFLQAAGVEFDGPDQLPMPAEFLENIRAGKRTESAPRSPEFVNEMKRQFPELPYFLRGAMPGFFGIARLSIRDVFWAGGIQRFVHPYMDGALFLIVDRRRKTIRSSLSCALWAQPLYVFLSRDGTYLCGSCSRLNGILMIRPCAAGLPKLIRLRNRVDAEVVGQIVGIVRRLK